MITKILIDKNTNDSWSIISPFSGYTCTSSENGFFISNVPNQTVTGYVDLPSLLVSLGTINRSVDILSSSGLTSDATLDGVGGLTKIGDWNFILNNINNIISPLMLMGRKITVKVEDTTIFTGRIYKCDPTRNNIKFIVRSNFLLWDKEIGTVIESDLDSSNNKIIPIIYGDFTSEGSYIPLIVDIEDDRSIKCYTSEQTLYEITNIFVWDSNRLVADMTTNGLDDLTISAEKTDISFKQETDITLEANLTDTNSLDIVYLNVLPTIGIQFTTSPSFTNGWIFKSTNNGDNYYRYIEKIGNIYIFEVGKDEDDLEYFLDPQYGNFDSLKPSESTNAFIRVTTSATYTVDSVSDIFVPPIFARQIDWDAETSVLHWTNSIAGPQFDYNDMVRSRIIQIDDEKMLVYQSVPVYNTSAYTFYSKHEVFRGYSNTSIVTHNYTTATVSIKQDIEDNTEYTVKMKTVIPITTLSNWRTLFYIYDGGSGYTKGHKNVREVVDTMLNFDYFLNNFSYQDTDTGKLIIYMKDFVSDIDHSDYWGGTITTVWGSLLLDLELGQTTDISGEISGIWLLGSYEVERVGGSPGTDIVGDGISLIYTTGISLGMRSTEDSVNFKRVGINLYNASLLGLNRNNDKLGLSQYIFDGTKFDLSYLHILSDIVSWEPGIDSLTFEAYSNNPATGSIWEKSFPLTGTWEQYGTGRKYTTGTVTDPKMPKTLEDFYKQRFVLQLHGQSEKTGGLYTGTNFKINNVGFLVEYTVDVRETDLWFQCKGRINSSGALLTNPVDIIEDILLDEVGLTSGDIDSTTFTAAATASTSTCAFALYDKQILSSKILKTICKEHGLILGELSNGKAACFNINDDTSVYTIANSDILLNSDNTPYYEESITSLDNLITELTIKYEKRYTDDTFLSQYIPSGIFDEAIYYLDQERTVTVETETIRDSTSATVLSINMSTFYTLPLRKITLHCDSANVNTLIPGQWIDFASETYVKNVTDNKYLILETDNVLAYGNTKPKTTLTLLEKLGISIIPSYQDTDGSSLVMQDTDGGSVVYQM